MVVGGKIRYILKFLQDRSKKIILIANKHPNKLHGLRDGLASIFSSALCIKIEKAKRKTKMLIVEQISNNLQIELDNSTMKFIVDNSSGDIRIIEGMVNKLKAYTLIEKKKITIKVATKVLHDDIKKKTSKKA